MNLRIKNLEIERSGVVLYVIFKQQTNYYKSKTNLNTY